RPITTPHQPTRAPQAPPTSRRKDIMAREVIRRPGPSGEVPSMQDEFQRMIRQVFGDADASLAGAFSPALDVEENDEAFTLHVEIPGVKADDVDVSIEENVLTIA